MLRAFTRDDLADYDGTDGKPAYVAYNGKVYDVTNGPTWVNGEHSQHSAGMDLSPDMEDAPHGEEALDDMPLVGEFID